MQMYILTMIITLQRLMLSILWISAIVLHIKLVLPKFPKNVVCIVYHNYGKCSITSTCKTLKNFWQSKKTSETVESGDDADKEDEEDDIEEEEEVGS